MSPRAVARSGARRVAATLGLAALIVLLAHPVAGAASDVWGNVGPRLSWRRRQSPARYPLTNYALDQHFDAVEASLTGGVDVNGVPPMIAWFLASLLWLVTSFLANLLITLFSFAFSLDLVNGSQATGGQGALAPVSARDPQRSTPTSSARPGSSLAVAVAGIWAMWKALVQRRYSETAGALGLSPDLRRPRALLRRPAGDARSAASRSGRTRCRGRSCRSPPTAAPRAPGRPRRTPPTSSSTCSSSSPGSFSTSAGSNTASAPAPATRTPIPSRSRCGRSPPIPTATPRSLAAFRAGPKITADGKVCINNANKYAPASSASASALPIRTNATASTTP